MTPQETTKCTTRGYSGFGALGFFVLREPKDRIVCGNFRIHLAWLASSGCILLHLQTSSCPVFGSAPTSQSRVVHSHHHITGIAPSENGPGGASRYLYQQDARALDDRRGTRRIYVMETTRDELYRGMAKELPLGPGRSMARSGGVIGVQEARINPTSTLFCSCICTLIYKDHDTTGTGGPSMREAGVDEEKEQNDLYASTSSFLDIE